jgi:hypothetical protein
MPRTLRVLANGALYTAGHDTQQDDARISTFAQAEGEAARYSVDWTGRFSGATPSAVWTVTGANSSAASVTGPVASITVSGLTEGNVAELTCTASAGSEIGVARFRIACPNVLPVSGVI